jgi:DNA processing protein
MNSRPLKTNFNSSQALLSLLELPRFGKKTVMNFIDHLESDLNTPEELIEFLTNVPEEVKRPKVPTEIDARAAILSAQDIITRSEDAGLHVLGWADQEYPDRLRSIPDPPLVLFVKGDLSGLSSDLSVALIGTREPSDFGRRSAHAIGKSLAEAGSTVVSGLALGCDTEGHLGCLDGGGITVAVMAHGLDKVSPARNRPLADRILSEGGCLISEYPLGTEARRHHFVERDRLQSGLSDAVVVAETGLKGGSMHTVGFCEAQGRELRCIKHPEGKGDVPSAEGNRMLIESGRAQPLSDKADVAALVELLRSRNGGVPEPEGEQIQKPLASEANQLGLQFENDE